MWLVSLTTEAPAASPAFRVRALWIAPWGFAKKEAADATLERCERAGFNVLLCDVMINQTVAFRSPHFAGQVLATDDFDPLAYFVKSAHARQMKVEAWCCVYYEGGLAASLPPLKPDWLVQTMSGAPAEQRFLSPSIPAVNEYLLPVFRDLLAYDVDGIHLDYIRYPGTTFDYSAAGRATFKTECGFDPLDFLDHPERILGARAESYPVRVLFPDAHKAKAWETTGIERTLDQTKLGYAFVSESADAIAKLKVPGLLVLSSYYDPPNEMIAAICEFAARGGDLLWTDAPDKGLKKSSLLRQTLGVRASTWRGKVRGTLAATSATPRDLRLPSEVLTTNSSYELTPDVAAIAATIDDGRPAVTVHRSAGRAVVVGPHLMKSTSPAAVEATGAIVRWLRDAAGVGADDPLAAARATWVAWRADRVTQLVRKIHSAAQAKTPPVEVSSSGGPAAAELHACYRDARRWLAEGLNEHVFPMNYTEDPGELDDILTVQDAAAPPGTKGRIYPGLQTYSRRQENGRTVSRPLDAAIVAKQIELVGRHGYEGFAIFSSHTLSDEIIEVVRQKAEGAADE